jgi:hypothetical protein
VGTDEESFSFIGEDKGGGGDKYKYRPDRFSKSVGSKKTVATVFQPF